MVAGVRRRLAVDERVRALVLVAAVAIVRNVGVYHAPVPPRQLRLFLGVSRAAERRGSQADQDDAQLGYLLLAVVPVEVHPAQHIRVGLCRRVVRFVDHNARSQSCEALELAGIFFEHLVERLHRRHNDGPFVQQVGHFHGRQGPARPPEPMQAKRRAPLADRLKDLPEAAHGLLAQLFGLRHPHDEL